MRSRFPSLFHAEDDFEPAARLPFAGFASSAVTLYWLSHTLLEMEGELAKVGLLRAIRAAVFSPMGGLVIALSLLTFATTLTLVYRTERRVHSTTAAAFGHIGADCVRWGVGVALVLGVAAAVITLLNQTLLNAWDQGFVWVAVAILYIGLWFYWYNGVPLSQWMSNDREILLKQLELIWDQQKMYLRAFTLVIFTILIGQVFAVMRLKYGNLWEDPAVYQEQTPHILVNAVQLAFLIAGWWGLVVARLLRRMEQIQLVMREINGPHNNRMQPPAAAGAKSRTRTMASTSRGGARG